MRPFRIRDKIIEATCSFTLEVTLITDKARIFGLAFNIKLQIKVPPKHTEPVEF